MEKLIVIFVAAIALTVLVLTVQAIKMLRRMEDCESRSVSNQKRIDGLIGELGANKRFAQEHREILYDRVEELDRRRAVQDESIRAIADCHEELQEAISDIKDEKLDALVICKSDEGAIERVPVVKFLNAVSGELNLDFTPPQPLKIFKKKGRRKSRK